MQTRHANAAPTVVGYNTTTIQGTDAEGNAKLYLLGFQFKGVTAENDQISLKDVIDMSNIPAFAGKWKDRTKAGNAASLQLWDGLSFDTYYWVAPACSGLEANAWVAGTGSAADIGPTTFFKTGNAAWFQAKPLGAESATITFAGAVKTDDSTAIPFGAGELSMGTNPYPMNYNIKDIVPSCAAFTGKWKDRTKGNAPMLQVWDGVSFDSYYWVAPACSSLEKDAWVSGTGSAVVTDAFLPIGAGFWFKNVSGEAGTLTFTYKAN